MPRLIIHDHALRSEELEDLRLERNLAMSPAERMKLAFNLMAFALRFRKDPVIRAREGAMVLKKRA